MQTIILFGILISTYLMVIAKRIPALIRGFRLQSFFLFLATLTIALREHQIDLYIVAGFLFIIKVTGVPYLLYRVIKKINVKEDLGLFINAQLSLLCALALTYLSWFFAGYLVAVYNTGLVVMMAVAFFVVLIGIFLMIFRMTALSQIIGLLVMENGVFLLASTVSGGMPFFVEIAIFFDVFVSVIIMGFFIYRINKLFTHIDVNKLSRLRG
jgi:hydrogenase-4 component E